MATNSKLHIAVFPWLAFGHLLPHLELAKLIAQKGHKISFISTPRNIDRLPKLPQHLAASMNFVKFTLPLDENLPGNAEATTDIPYHKIPYLKKAFDGLQEPLAQFLEASSPDWIIYDFAHHWLPSIAAKLRISRALFFIFSAWTTCFGGSSSSAMINGDDPRNKPEHFTVSPDWVPFPTNVAFREHEANKVLDIFNVNHSGLSDMCRLGWAISGCDVFILRSCFELESDWLKLVGQLHQKPIVPTGLLPPTTTPGSHENIDNSWLVIDEWLGKQKIGSVVYVAFGSEADVNQEQLTELALGLEISCLPFFWALRKQQDLVLPDGFEERIKGRGVVWTSWAPQLRILAHDSVAGFLTHCGWSSVIEGIHFGRALVMLPFQADEGLIARVFEEKMVGKEIPRDEQNGSFTRDLVATTLRLVIAEHGGRIYREKAKEMMQIFADKDLHDRYVDKLVEYLENYKND